MDMIEKAIDLKHRFEPLVVGFDIDRIESIWGNFSDKNKKEWIEPDFNTVKKVFSKEERSKEPQIKNYKVKKCYIKNCHNPTTKHLKIGRNRYCVTCWNEMLNKIKESEK